MSKKDSNNTDSNSEIILSIPMEEFIFNSNCSHKKLRNKKAKESWDKFVAKLQNKKIAEEEK